MNARRILESTYLESDEKLFSLEIENYTEKSLSRKQLIERLESYISRKNDRQCQERLQKITKLAVSQVHFQCNDSWFVQINGLAMVPSMAVIYENLWHNGYKLALKMETLEVKTLKKRW